MTEFTSLPAARDFLFKTVAEEAGYIVALTGAGISTESGIPDFRSPGGLWSRLEPVLFQDFIAKSESRMEDWRRRFEMEHIFEKAKPNAAHDALALMAKSGDLATLITQNIDNLHQRAGVPENKLIELHGNSTYATCLECSNRAELDEIKVAYDQGREPVCSACGGLMKAAVISFGQAMPQQAMFKAAEAADRAGLFIVIGSSLQVHPAAELPLLATRAGARLVIVNRDPTPLDQYAEALIRTPISETFEGLGGAVFGL